MFSSNHGSIVLGSRDTDYTFLRSRGRSLLLAIRPRYSVGLPISSRGFLLVFYGNNSSKSTVFELGQDRQLARQTDRQVCSIESSSSSSSSPSSYIHTFIMRLLLDENVCVVQISQKQQNYN